jgi:hypothetical protein
MGFYLEVSKGSQFVLGGTVYAGGEHYIENESLWADVVSSVNAGVPIKARRPAPGASAPEPVAEVAESAVGNEFPEPEEFTPEPPLTSAHLKKVGGTAAGRKTP